MRVSELEVGKTYSLALEDCCLGVDVESSMLVDSVRDALAAEYTLKFACGITIRTTDQDLMSFSEVR
jgi:hypothetical protein